MPTSFSERFSACILQPSTPAPASGLRPYSASCTGTGGASGPKGKSAREPCFSSRWRSLGRRLPLRSEEHTSELQSRLHLVCRLLLEKKKKTSIHLACTTHTIAANVSS